MKLNSFNLDLLVRKVCTFGWTGSFFTLVYLLGTIMVGIEVKISESYLSGSAENAFLESFLYASCMSPLPSFLLSS